MQMFILFLGLVILYLAATNKLYKIVDIVLQPLVAQQSTNPTTVKAKAR